MTGRARHKGKSATPNMVQKLVGQYLLAEVFAKGFLYGLKFLQTLDHPV